MTYPLKVLVVEDSADDALIVLAELERLGYETAHRQVMTAESLSHALEHPWDLVIGDFSMPGFSGLEALRLVRECDADLPFIFVSGTMGEDVAVNAMRSGAQDYIVKGNMKRLGPAIARELREAANRRTQKVTEARWRRAEHRFRRIFESNMIGIVFWATDGRVVEANTEYLRIIGRTSEDVAAGRINWRETIAVESHRLLPDLEGQLALTGVLEPFEVTIVRPGGAKVAILVGAALFAGVPDQGVSFVLDISARRRLEDALRQSQKMDAVGRLASGVAHDFNNLLGVITGYTDLVIRRMPETDPSQEDLREVQHAAKSCAALTRQLLTFSRPSSGDVQVVALEEIVARMQGLMRPALGKRVTLVLRLCEAHSMVRVDPGQIEQVILNLAINARDAMPDGGQIEVHTTVVGPAAVREDGHASPSDGRYVRLSIRDTGEGMSEETRARIFEPFFTTKGAGLGTGLGLAIVYGIVQHCGGFIRCVSELGRGTEFRIHLPIVADQS